MKKIYELLVFLLIVGSAGSAMALSFSYDGSLQENVDTNPATSVFLNAYDMGIIADLNLWVDIDGSVNTDLDISLIHNGATVQVYEGSKDNTGEWLAVWFDDQASTIVPTTGSVEGYYQPSPDSLSAFNGLELSGTWELQILDDYVPNEGDRLFAWSISGEYTPAAAPVPEPATMLLFGTGLVGLAGLSIKRKKKK